MIAVDTSVLVAIVLGEPERVSFRLKIADSTRALMSTVSALEAKMVVYGRRGPRTVVLLDDLLRLPMFQIVSPTLPDMDAAMPRSSRSAKAAVIPRHLISPMYSPMPWPRSADCRCCSRAMTSPKRISPPPDGCHQIVATP